MQPTGFLPRRLEYAANRVLAATLHSSNDFQPWNDCSFASRPTISQFCKLAMWIWHISERVFLVLDVRHSSLVFLAAHMIHHPPHAFRVFPAQFAVECTIWPLDNPVNPRGSSLKGVTFCMAPTKIYFHLRRVGNHDGGLLTFRQA